MQTLFRAVDVELTPDEALAMAHKAIAAYTANWRLFPDVRPSLERMAALPLGIISNGDSRQQRAKLDTLGLTPFFEKIHISSFVFLFVFYILR